MSYRSSQRLAGWKLALFAFYIFFALLLVPVSLFASVAAGCPAFGPAQCEPVNGWVRYALFPGVLLATILFGFWLRRRLHADR